MSHESQFGVPPETETAVRRWLRPSGSRLRVHHLWDGRPRTARRSRMWFGRPLWT